MKLKAILFCLISTLLSVAQADDLFSIGADGSCVLDAEGVKCWGHNEYGQLKVPKIKMPLQLSTGSNHNCVLDAEGVKCWGYNYYGQTEVPALNSPVQVSAGSNRTCALDADGVKCWGHLDSDVPPLQSPTQVSVGDNHTCAIDAKGVICWGGPNSLGGLDIPVLNSPIQVSAGRAHNCALDRNGVKCWGSNSFGESDVPPLRNPTQVSAGPFNTCALDADGVKCWGNITEKAPSLLNPTKIVAGEGGCALDSNGTVCWGGPFAGLRWKFDLVRAAIPFVNVARAEYLKGISNLVLPVEPNFLLYILAAPAIISADSAYFTNEFVPNFNDFILRLQRHFKYSDILSVPDAEKERRIAITAIKSALEVYLNRIDSKSAPVQESLRKTGIALQDPMNNQKVIDLIQKLDALQIEKKNLKSSPRVAFLAESLELAANWLREKVK
jgi:hypothetical protein